MQVSSHSASADGLTVQQRAGPVSENSAQFGPEASVSSLSGEYMGDLGTSQSMRVESDDTCHKLHAKAKDLRDCMLACCD